MRLNLGAVLHVTHAYVGAMVDAGWGRVVTVVSDAGRRGERFQAIYGAAKAGAMGFMRGLAAEVGAHGVTANCVSLGTMKSGPTEEAIERESRPRAQARAAVHRAAPRARPRSRRCWSRCCAATPASGSPARCIPSTGATPPRSEAAIPLWPVGLVLPWPVWLRAVRPNRAPKPGRNNGPARRGATSSRNSWPTIAATRSRSRCSSSASSPCSGSSPISPGRSATDSTRGPRPCSARARCSCRSPSSSVLCSSWPSADDEDTPPTGLRLGSASSWSAAPPSGCSISPAIPIRRCTERAARSGPASEPRSGPLLGTTGAVIVLVAVGVLGLLLVVGTGIRQVGTTIRAAAQYLGRHLRTFFSLAPPVADDAPASSPARAVLFHDFDLDLVERRGASRARRGAGRRGPKPTSTKKTTKTKRSTRRKKKKRKTTASTPKTSTRNTTKTKSTKKKTARKTKKTAKSTRTKKKRTTTTRPTLGPFPRSRGSSRPRACSRRARAKRSTPA